MYLKKIEIYGFKSFADKIEIDLLPGITAIVGPNGSGKSNIADAIRWVLGEQSPKILRGSKMEDVIFAGTDIRKAVGMAEVSLTLDNSDRTVDMDYSEIKITRRMFKSGESEYYLNKTLCRLKDIQQLFMDTGIGKEGYSIIGQGRIDQLLSDRPEDRRGVFEEAAGIVKYKVRKLDAQKKLEQAVQNLQRVEDVLRELETQLLPLEAESRKARRYIELLGKQKEIDINIFLFNYHRLKEQIGQTERQRSELQEELSQQQQQQQICNSALQSHKQRLAGFKDKIEVLHADILNNRQRSEKLKGFINQGQQQMEYLDAELIRLQQEMQKDKAEQQQYKELTVQRRSELEDLHQQHSRVLSQVEEYKKQLNDINGMLTQHQTLAKSGEDQIMDMMDRQSQLKSELSALTSKLQSVDNRLSRLDADLEELYASENHLVSAKLRAANGITDIKQRIEQCESTLKSIAQSLSETETTLKHVTEQRTAIDRSIHSDTTKLKLLRDMENNLEGFNRSVKLIMDRRAQDARMAKGIYGPVARLIHIDAGYEAAFEAALGGTLQYLVVGDEDDARYAIDFLKAQHGGRATFLPISSIKPRSLNNREKAVIGYPGCIGIACDIVKFDAKFTNIMRYLLGRVVICSDLAHAIEIARAFNYSFQIATLEGDIVGNGGYISGGSQKRSDIGMLGRATQMRQLQESIEACRRRYAALSKQMDELLAALDGLRQQQSAAEQQERQYRIEYARMDETLNNIEQQLNMAACKRQAMEDERAALLNDKASIEQAIDQCRSELLAIEQQRQCFAQDAQQHDQRIQELNKKKEAVMHQLAQAQVEEATLNSRCTSLQKEISDLEARIKALTEDDERKMAEIKRCSDDKTDAIQQLEHLRDELAEVDSVGTRLEQELKRLEEEQDTCYIEVAQTERRLQELNDVISDIQSRLYKCDVQKQQLEDQLQRIQDELWESYQLSYASALNYKIDGFELSAASKSKKAIKEAIAELGSVNPGAIDEYERLYQRVSFLRHQHDDIQKGMQVLEELIKELEAHMRQQFAEQFAMINDRFQHTFYRLFGGGNASLILEDGDVLESGIDIIAQPPGKKLQNIMLLSGGERTLTAIAILFALLEIRPSPFCVLDEIEAALDEVNVQRFAKFIKDYGSRSQFIIITHRRATMEVASALYGVSMVERGVSRLISVQLDEKIG